MISKLCYALYKVDWLNDHISPQREVAAIKDYYENVIDDAAYIYDDYLEEFGYDGELYVCYEEFLDNEYQDDTYICGLLKDEELIEKYYQDLKERICN